MEDRDLRYPLHWPHGRERTPAHQRQKPPFFATGRQSNSTGASWSVRKDLPFGAARDRLMRELDAVGARSAVLSTNLELRLDGLPRGGVNPEDPGVAVYFARKVGGQTLRYALCCDRWSNVAGNMAAIAKHIEALRGMERWGCGTLDQAFTGYLRLEDGRGREPISPAEWRRIFAVRDGLSRAATLDEVERSYRERLIKEHPDAGGSHERMALLNAARDAARKELQS